MKYEENPRYIAVVDGIRDKLIGASTDEEDRYEPLLLATDVFTSVVMSFPMDQWDALAANAMERSMKAMERAYQKKMQ